MKFIELKKIKKFYFGYEDISRVLGISACLGEGNRKPIHEAGDTAPDEKKHVCVKRGMERGRQGGQIPAREHWARSLPTYH